MAKIITWMVFAACLAIGVGGVATSCTQAERDAAKADVIDCTSQNQTSLVNLLLKMSLPIFNGDVPDWAQVYAMAVGGGVAIGGCALALVVDDWVKHHAPQGLASDPALVTLERFRREQAGGAAFVFAAGIRR